MEEAYLSETWLSNNHKTNMPVINTCLDSGYTLHHRPRNTGRRGGGVGVLINNRIKHQSQILHDKPEITSFESIELVITMGSVTIRLSVIYPNDTAYKRWSCHSGFKLLCKLCPTSPPPAMGARFTVFWACGPAGWLALLLTKAGDVETNPGPTTLNKKVWICDICHKQIHIRKQISIWCNRIEHWVHLRCAGIRQAQYTDTWTCHLHRESRLTQT